MLNHHFFDHHHPLLNHHFFEHHGGGCRPLAKVLRLPRNWYLLRKCCACRTIWIESCTCRESVPDLAKVLRLLRNPYLTFRKYCDLAKVLRLLRNLYLTFLTPLICTRLTVINAPFAESSLLRSSSPFVESSFLRASWAAPPPNPPADFQNVYRDCRTLCSIITSSIITTRGTAAPPPPTTPLLICRMLAEPELNAPLVESSLPRTSWGGGGMATSSSISSSSSIGSSSSSSSSRRAPHV